MWRTIFSDCVGQVQSSDETTTKYTFEGWTFARQLEATAQDTPTHDLAGMLMLRGNHLRIRTSTAAGLALCGAAVVALLSTAVAQAAEPAVSPVVARERVIQPGDIASRYCGAGSCASTACHGAPANTKPDWKHAYTTWMTGGDPHSKAYAVLFEERSLNMLRQLRGLPADAKVAPYQESRCLACHATVATHEIENPTLLSDGVGCEACHGPARDWIADHSLFSWKEQGPQRFEQSGMVDTAPVASRAARCVTCHVGAPASDAYPTRDVNHDLIAAGHPRLNFEFSAYMARMPRHWDEGALRRRQPEMDEVRSYAIGQAVTAQAALALLKDRVTRVAATTADTDPLAGAIWPELSEYDCYSCHHGLRAQTRPAGLSGPGSLVWGTWSMRMPLALAEALSVAPAEALADRTLESRMEKPYATLDAGQLTAAIDARQAILRQLLVRVEDPATSKAAIQDATVQAIFAKPEAATAQWDGSAQRYLALVAIASNALTQNRNQVSADEQAWLDVLAAWRRQLAFGTPGEAQPVPQLKLDSPADYDPASSRQMIERLKAPFLQP